MFWSGSFFSCVAFFYIKTLIYIISKKLVNFALLNESNYFT